MKKLCSLFLFFLFLPAAQAALVEMTPSHVYSQAMQIEKEMELLKKHFSITTSKKSYPVTASLKPRHAWQKGYFILLKLNVLRSKNGLPRITPDTMEPVLVMQPGLVYEQTQRILTEFAIFKARLGITAQVSPAQTYEGKKPIDVFNKLHQVSMQMDILNDEEISPTYVFAEVMRVYEDIVTLLRWLNIPDHTYPPAKMVDVAPKDSLVAAFELLHEIQRLQRDVGVERTDFSIFKKKDNVLPSDVINIVGMALAELQTVKATIDLTSFITRAAEYHEIKTPADVHQLLRWTTRKLRLIRELR